MKFENRFLVISILCSSLLGSIAHSGIQAQATRVIYNSSNSAATLSLKNNADKPYMVQTWLTDNEDNHKEKLPMVVVPPLMKIAPEKESILRFIYSGQGLPQDQESLFWINLQEIPPNPTEENVLQIAIRSKIKLFYRPKQIRTTLDEAAKKIEWFKDGQQLKVKNTSPLHVTIGTIKDESGQVFSVLDKDMVAPNQTITVISNFKSSSKSISYTYINDFGGATTIPLIPIR